jgi:hypothetical protein
MTWRLENLKDALERSQKHPALGVTQGGSSRKNGGARVAARDADMQNPPVNVKK